MDNVDDGGMSCENDARTIVDRMQGMTNNEQVEESSTQTSRERDGHLTWNQ
jgi:hypothetical protein